jgi:hypothetical protein
MTTIPPTFLAAFYSLEAAFPDWKVKPSGQGIPGTLDVYWQALQDLDLADVISAIGGAIQSGQFAPRVADLRSQALGFAQDRARRNTSAQDALDRKREDEALTAAWGDPERKAAAETAIKSTIANLARLKAV